MRIILIVLVLACVACGRESSPEGRSQIRTERLQEQIDSLKIQNRQILDSLSEIRRTLRSTKKGSL